MTDHKKCAMCFSHEIKIEYNGKRPALCAGDLVAVINGKRFVFPENSLASGGFAYCSGDFDEIIGTAPWIINFWPENLPIDLRPLVAEKINDSIPHGCCGGCI